MYINTDQTREEMAGVREDNIKHEESDENEDLEQLEEDEGDEIEGEYEEDGPAAGAGAGPGPAAPEVKRAPIHREEFKGPTFSFTDGTPIARVRGGKYNKYVVGLMEEGCDDLADPDADPVILLGGDYFHDLRLPNKRRLTLQDLEALHDALKARRAPDDPVLKHIYEDAAEIFEDRCRKEVAIADDGIVIPLPRTDTRECLYVSGPSGSGKSTYCARYCLEARKMWPDVRIVIFSRVDNDPVLDIKEIAPERFKITDDFIDNPPQRDAFADAIVLMDDIDTIPNKKLADAVRQFRDDLLETGRHTNTTVISTSHLIQNWGKTRGTLNEATSVTFFPRSSSAYYVKKFLKEHAGLSPKQIQRVLDLPSRWVTVYRSAPQYFLHEKGCLLLG